MFNENDPFAVEKASPVGGRTGDTPQTAGGNPTAEGFSRSTGIAFGADVDSSLETRSKLAA
jgi:hypothetical protein